MRGHWKKALALQLGKGLGEDSCRNIIMKDQEKRPSTWCLFWSMQCRQGRKQRRKERNKSIWSFRNAMNTWGASVWQPQDTCSPGSDCVDMFLTCPGQQINGINEVSISIGDWGGGWRDRGVQAESHMTAELIRLKMKRSFIGRREARKCHYKLAPGLISFPFIIQTPSGEEWRRLWPSPNTHIHRYWVSLSQWA